MIHELSLVLREEQNIFRKFNSNRRISRKCVAYASPGSQEVPHWNMVYPPDGDHRYTAAELSSAEDFYTSADVTGHVLVTGDEWVAHSAETAEYFVAAGASMTPKEAPEIKEFSSHGGEDLADFCGIVQSAFALSDGTTTYFRKKMEILSAAVPSRFWIIEFQGRSCGTASIFTTKSGADFLFNFAILPEFQNKHLGTSMLKYVISRAAAPLYTYSPNPVMREKLLPGSGFRPIQTTYAVTLERYKATFRARNRSNA